MRGKFRLPTSFRSESVSSLRFAESAWNGSLQLLSSGFAVGWWSLLVAISAWVSRFFEVEKPIQSSSPRKKRPGNPWNLSTTLITSTAKLVCPTFGGTGGRSNQNAKNPAHPSSKSKRTDTTQHDAQERPKNSRLPQIG